MACRRLYLHPLGTGSTAEEVASQLKRTNPFKIKRVLLEGSCQGLDRCIGIVFYRVEALFVFFLGGCFDFIWYKFSCRSDY